MRRVYIVDIYQLKIISLVIPSLFIIAQITIFGIFEVTGTSTLLHDPFT
jgi:hypothetical protein